MKFWNLPWWLICLGLLSLNVGCVSVRGPKVQVTLSDGQRVVGFLTTQTLNLKSDLGDLTFDTLEAGELGLIEGKNIEQSGNMIKLWLRNGSEFVGHWEKPAIQISMEIGEQSQSIKIPIEKLKRLQFLGEAIWPTESVFRIVTQNGDDFFVDVTRTQMSFSNEMGSFAPYLHEIQQLEPLDADKKQWKIHLENGSLFIAKLNQTKLNLRLDMGPKTLELPLAAVKRMNREDLLIPQSLSYDEDQDNSPQGFFSNQLQKKAKQESTQRNTKKQN